MGKIYKFEQVYLDILQEQKSPTTFTPISLLNDIRDRCFFSKGDFKFYTVDDLKYYADEDHKELFKKFAEYLNNKNDFGMLIIYFTSIDILNEILNINGYFNPHNRIRNYPNKFNMQIVYNQIKEYFKDPKKTSVNYNSIDTNPQLGCVIAINGKNISSYRDFEKEVDHELNHYFEKMNIHYHLTKHVDNIIDIKNTEIISKLQDFYKINLSKKQSFIQDLKYHLFNYEQFRSMSANVFHEVLKYNERHLKELNYQIFINDILNCNYSNYPIELQEMMLFCWICKQISESRWIIILQGIKEAISIKKNIFQKFFIRGKDLFRNLILHF